MLILDIHPKMLINRFLKQFSPKTKIYTTFCFEVSGTDFVQTVKNVTARETYESKYISFKK